MNRCVSITCDFDLAIGKVNLNEIVYRLNEIKGSLMLGILREILAVYDDLISERLAGTKIYPSKMRKGLGQHIRKDDAEKHFCRGRKIYRRGYRNRTVKTVFGSLAFRVRVAECLTCGSRYSPLLNALQVEGYSRKEVNFEKEVIEAVIDTNYRRLIEGRSIDISLDGVHNIVVGSDIDKTFQKDVSLQDLSGIMADGTGVKQHKGSKGELRTVIGILQQGRGEKIWDSCYPALIGKHTRKRRSPTPSNSIDLAPQEDYYDSRLFPCSGIKRGIAASNG